MIARLGKFGRKANEIRVTLQKFGKLVDHNEKCRQRRKVSAAFAVLLVLGHAGQRAGRADLHPRLTQDRLAAVQFTGQHLAHPAYQLGFLGHVG